jgi:DNA-binding CsgD family transcriptional regulator
MPKIRDLLGKYTGPSIQEVADNPDRYPQEYAQLAEIGRKLQEQFAELTRKSLEQIGVQFQELDAKALAPFSGQLHRPLAESVKALLAPLNEQLQTSIAEIAKALVAPLNERLLSSFEEFMRNQTRELGQRFLDIFFRPNTLSGDLMIARYGDPRKQGRERKIGMLAALERLSQRLHWWPFDDQAKEALKRRIRENGQREYFNTFASALYIAFSNDGVPQYIRLGKDWLTDERGKKVKIPPKQLPIPIYWRWLRKETINEMERDILGELPGPQVIALGDRDEEEDSGDVVVDWKTLRAPDPDPEEALLLQELEREQQELVARIQALCSPRERELLKHVIESPSLADAAEKMGISPSTARVMMNRIRKKVETYV